MAMAVPEPEVDPATVDAAAQALTKLLWPAHIVERDELDILDKLWRMEHDMFRLPRKATREHKALQQLARTPYLDLLVTAITQGLHVDGYRSPEDADMADGWETWLRNGMPKNQNPVHRDATGYGLGYVRLFSGDPVAQIKPRSPRKLTALYSDPAYDEWPQWVLEIIGTSPADKNKRRVNVLDSVGRIHVFDLDAQGNGIEYIRTDNPGGSGFCPVVRYTFDLDSEGRNAGVIDKNKTTALRIEKTDYDRLLVQHFNSWKVRTIAGLIADAEKTKDAEKLRLAQEDILIAEDADTKFGTLDETSLDPIINAKNADVESLAGTGQVPGTALTGKVSNLSADAIGELRWGLTSLQFTLKTSYGQSHNQALRGVARLEGREDDANDYEAGVSWQDMTATSMAGAVDALGKLTQMLGVPPEALWGKIPGFTQNDVREWQTLATRDENRARLDALRQKAAEARGTLEQAGLAQPANRLTAVADEA